jgi:hypothetical protein
VGKEYRAAWTTPTDWSTVVSRAGGRRRYNSWRRQMATMRRADVAGLVDTHGMVRGSQARIARKLGVSEATISRDIKRILDERKPCPTCGRPLPARS